MMKMDGLNKNNEHLIYLISCALCGIKANEDVLGEMDLAMLFPLAWNHAVSAMVCMSLEKTETFRQAESTIKKQWLEAKNKAVRKNMLLDAERQILLDKMEKAEIWHMPLKGSILKDWYPCYGMREMADNDILFDEMKRAQVKELFVNAGYSIEAYNKGNHDVYQKLPVLNFEMHVSLFNESVVKDFAEKYKDIKERLLPDEDKNFRFHFRQEDFYVFVLAHAYKHYSHSGTGIRTLADIYVMNRKIGQSMDWNYVDRELKKLGIQKYEQCSRVLADKIFGSGKPLSELELSSEEQEMLLYYLGAGTYGNVANQVKNSLHDLQANEEEITFYTKLRYFRSRVFPGREFCKEAYPIVYQHPYLLPFFWVWRGVKCIYTNRKKVVKELFALISSK